MVKQVRMMLASIAMGLVALAAIPADAQTDATSCGAETARQERLQAIPDRLLHAISLVESGRWDADRKASFAWPWTVTAEGDGRFLPSKAAAVAEVRRLQAEGVRNIDVGCMQVNLQAHPDAFASLDEAFDPATNVAYAARFLYELHASTQDWPTAAAYYHSQTPSLAAPYKARLVSTWDAARRRGDDRLQWAVSDNGLQNRPPVGMLPPLPPGIGGDGRALRRAELPKRAVESEARTAAERVEAKRIADAYRQARLEEYRVRKAQTVGG
jgi:hypothetical protein